MPGKACIDTMLAELRPVEPLDDVARRELDELVRLRAKHGETKLSRCMAELGPQSELRHFRWRDSQPPPTLTPGLGWLLQENPSLHWEEKFAILVVLWTALRFFI